MGRNGQRESTAAKSDPVRRSQRGALLPLLLALSIGVAAGVGGYTFRYAEGLSYLSTDPRACVNCHIMQPQYDAWQKASHHQSAVCVDCHLPQAFFSKYVAKTENGWRHGKKFTTQNFVEPIVVQAAGRAILQENCLRCHGDLVHGITGVGARDEAFSCLHCHSNAGHGEKTGLGPPLRTSELHGEPKR